MSEVTKYDTHDLACLRDLPAVVVGASDYDALAAECERYEDGMRAIACKLSAGGYNAAELSAEQLLDKVNWGIENFTSTTGSLLDILRGDLDAALSELAALKAPAEAEGVEVVGWRDPSLNWATIGAENKAAHLSGESWRAASVRTFTEALMTVAQHQRILSAVTAERDAENSRLHEVAVACATAEQERDQLRAEVAIMQEKSRLSQLLPELDDALEDLELHGCHSDQGYRKLKDWYRKTMLATRAIDAAMAAKEG